MEKEPDLSKARQPRGAGSRGPRPPAPTPDSAEIAPIPPEEVQSVLPKWQPRQVVKVTTQMTVEHRQLMDHLEKTTGQRMWELIRDAIEEKYAKGK